MIMLSLMAFQRSWSLKATRLLAGCQYAQGGLKFGKRSVPLVLPPQHLQLDDSRKSFHSLTRLPPNDDVLFSPFGSSNSNHPNSFPRQPLHPFQPQQVRWKRKGGASAFSKPRPPTQKQRKTYNRWKKNLHWQKVGRHSKPGSKAADRRIAAKQDWDDLMMYGTPERQALIDKYAPKASEYDHHDAILEDLMGNTSHLTSQPTPYPRYLGHKQEKYFTKVQNAMNAYLQYKEEQQSQIESGNRSNTKEPGKQGDSKSVVIDLGLAERLLPTDSHIATALRAYRDKFGTKQKPIGIAKALQHLLKDLRLPTSLFGEWTYITLLTCCRTPAEAQRIFKMQRDAQHPISSHSWSILVDVHAKLGDYEGCVQVIKEMAAEGVTPTMPAYTSLLAACYKVCADGRIPQAVRVQAYEVGWNKWKEMRIIGLDPDVMAYGAMLRLCAVKGHPERAINLLEEMPIMDVKPTTLCFTSALRAVARSQEIATRYERGWSKKNKRREQITLHHGKMARSIVILAENAEVKQDDGFVSALMLCAAAAGDSATAKAIYLASDVRKMDQLRTIGSDAHLQRLQGKQVPFDNYNRQQLGDGDKRRSMIMGHDKSIDDNLLIESGGMGANLGVVESSVSSNSTSRALSDKNARGNALQSQEISILSTPSLRRRKYPSFGEREYGKDTRKLNALLHACAKALDGQNGLGTMWGGRENLGYLCENSLRLINARPQPKYFDSSIPNVDPVEVAMTAIDFDRVTEGIEDLPRRARRDRINKLDLDPNAALSIYDLDDEATKAITGRDIKKEMDEEERREREKEERWNQRRMRIIEPNAQITAGPETSTTVSQDAEEMYFDHDEMKWKSRPRQQVDSRVKGSLAGDRTVKTVASKIRESSHVEAVANTVASQFNAKASDIMNAESGFDASTKDVNDSDDDSDLELYVDEEDMSLKTRPKKRSDHGHSEVQASTTSTKLASKQEEEESYFDNEEMKWKTRPKASTSLTPTAIEGAQTVNQDDSLYDGEELYFDYDDMQWKSRPRRKQIVIAKVDDKRQRASKKDDSSISKFLDEFEMDGQNKELAQYLMSLENGLEDHDDESLSDDEDLDVAEARNLLQQLKSEYSTQGSQGSGFFLNSQSHKPEKDDSDTGIDTDELEHFLDSLRANETPDLGKSDVVVNEFKDFMNSLEQEEGEKRKMRQISSRSQVSERQLGEKWGDGFAGLRVQPQKQEAHLPEVQQSNLATGNSTAFLEDFEELAKHAGLLPRNAKESKVSASEVGSDVKEASFSEKRGSDVYMRQPKHSIEALQMALPGLPLSRIHRIREAFRGSLGDPSLLKLVPLLRENMPEYVTPGWLKQMNLQNAYFAFEKANEEGVVDIYLLNGILEVETSAGRLDRTIQLYEEEFHKFNLTPTEYSDRLVLQMLVKNDRLTRALVFKEKLERAGRTVDIQAYGTLMDYYGRKEQLGSALLVLRECLAVHGAPPGEASLTRIRTLCRRQDLEKQVGLKEMIGDDPLDWLRDGEIRLKREYSKKGNRDVNIPSNRLLHI